MKLALFSKIIDKSRVSKVNLISSIITALQPLVMVAKDIFPFATVTDDCKEIIFMEIPIKNTFFWNFQISGVQNSIFMGKSHEIYLFTTVSHSYKGQNINSNHDSWLQRHNIYENGFTSETKYLLLNLAKKSQFHFLFFKIDSQNPKLNLEYLLCNSVWGKNKSMLL